MTDAAASIRFVREAHGAVRDLLAANVRRYWGDFLLTILLAYAAFAIYVRAPWFSLAQAGAFVICGLAMYRAIVFTHEITHRRGAAFRVFTFAWNLLCGIPFLMPSFLYGDHKEHHTSLAYGTWSDPEYIMRTAGWRLRVFVFLLLPIVYPLFAAVRFLVLTPLAILSRGMDRVVWTRASSLYVMNESYRREYDAAAHTTSRWVQEVGCSAWAWLVASAAIIGFVGGGAIGKAYLVFLFWIGVNQVRTLVAHRYANETNGPLSHLEQLLDTNTFPRGRWLPELWAPLGLRYHALHHLLPMLPYHAMGEAHARLMTQLPPGSAYHRTIRAGLWPALVSILRDRERHTAYQHAGPSPMPSEDRQGSR